VDFRSSSKLRPGSISIRPELFPSIFFQVYDSPVILPTTIHNPGKIIALKKSHKRNVYCSGYWARIKKLLKQKRLSETECFFVVRFRK
jgi:hypothetical protein